MTVMTQSDQDNPNKDEARALEAGGAVKPGIYLEEKKSSIGTGGTAKTAEFRNFWATLLIRENKAEMVLLDDDFRPTGLRESFAFEILSGPGWHFIAEGEKRYQRLRPHLDRLLAPPAPKPAEAKPAAPKAAKWWEGGGETGGPAKDPFALDKKPKTAPAPKKGGWWDK